MTISVFSSGPSGPVSTPIPRLRSVNAIADQLRGQGHRALKVGGSLDTALPLDQWLVAAAGVEFGGSR